MQESLLLGTFTQHNQPSLPSFEMLTGRRVKDSPCLGEYNNVRISHAADY